MEHDFAIGKITASYFQTPSYFAKISIVTFHTKFGKQKQFAVLILETSGPLSKPNQQSQQFCPVFIALNNDNCLEAPINWGLGFEVAP